VGDDQQDDIAAIKLGVIARESGQSILTDGGYWIARFRGR
jgi:hypothetical protein